MNYIAWPAIVLCLDGPLWAKAVGIVGALILAATLEGATGPRWIKGIGFLASALWAAVAAAYSDYGFALYGLSALCVLGLLGNVGPAVRQSVQAVRRWPPIEALEQELLRGPRAGRWRRVAERAGALAVLVGLLVVVNWASDVTAKAFGTPSSAIVVLSEYWRYVLNAVVAGALCMIAVGVFASSSRETEGGDHVDR